MLFKRIWMLSCLCCCIAVFTLHMYASRMGINACLKNANVSQLHFVHTTLNRYFLCSNISCILVGIKLTFLNEPHLFFFFFFFYTSVLQDHHHLLCVWHDVLLCLSGALRRLPLVWTPRSSYQHRNRLHHKLRVDSEVMGLSISMDRLFRRCKSGNSKGFLCLVLM